LRLSLGRDSSPPFVSDIDIFVLKGGVKLYLLKLHVDGAFHCL